MRFLLILLLMLGAATAAQCFQESANVSTACGGLNTGSYSTTGAAWTSPNNVIDGNWGTYGTGGTGSYLNMSYTIPANTSITGTRWQIENGNVAYYNISFNGTTENCFAGKSTLLLSVFATTTGTDNQAWRCYTGAAWVDVHTYSQSTKGARAYEDAMHWNITKVPLITLNLPNNNSVSSNTSYNFNWTVTSSDHNYFLNNLTIDGVLNQSNIPSQNGVIVNKTVTGFNVGAHSWSVTSWNGTMQNTSNTFYFNVTAAATFNSMVGGPTSWVWETVDPGDIVPHGTKTGWTWGAWNPGSGNYIINGTKTAWAWVLE